jgi:C-terminal peptidase prc
MAEGKQLSAVEIHEGRELLTRMPKLKSQQSLRKAYQQLVDGSLTVDKFEAERQRISEQAKLKRAAAMDFAKTVMEASSLLREHYVKELNQGQLIDWAIRGMYRSLEEKLPPEITDRLGKVKEMRDNELTQLLADARERLGAREDLADHKDVDMALRRMTVHLDPYTTYWDPETVRRLESDIRGNFTGIGIQIRKNTARDLLQVATPLRDSPAHKAGLQTGDLITHITTLVDSKGKPLTKPETVSTKGMPMNDAVKKILGPRGTPVKITVEREGADKPLEFTIRRNRIEVESVLGFRRKTDNDWDYLIDSKDKIAYVRLTSFQEGTAADLEKLMVQLHKQKVKGLILDLRHNPGGLLKSAVAISDMYIDDGLIVSIRPRSGPETKYSGFHEGSYLDFPMVCLVNGGSASGSEIVAACLQDHKRALIVGERSYGKGSVQNIEPFADGEIKFTTASFWRPNGKNLNKSSTAGKEDEDWGVRPDKGYEVKLSRKEQEELLEHEEDVKVIPAPNRPGTVAKSEFKDRQLDKALEYLHEQIQKVARAESKK